MFGKAMYLDKYKKTIMYYHQRPEENKDSIMFQGVFILE
jgi:hypothetical protein